MWWFTFALVLGAGILALVLWLRSKNIVVAWYEWLMGALGVLLIVAAVQHYAGSLVEGYPISGWMGVLILGLPAIILLAIAWQLIARRQRAAS